MKKHKLRKLWDLFQPLFQEIKDANDINTTYTIGLYVNADGFNEADVLFSGMHIETYTNSSFSEELTELEKFLKSVAKSTALSSEQKEKMLKPVLDIKKELLATRKVHPYEIIYNKYFCDADGGGKLCNEAYKMLKSILGDYFKWSGTYHFAVDSSGKVLLMGETFNSDGRRNSEDDDIIIEKNVLE